MKEQKRLDYPRADRHYQNVYGEEALTANGENDMRSTLKNSRVHFTALQPIQYLLRLFESN